MADHQTDALNFSTLQDLLRRRWYVLLLWLLVPAATLAFSLAQEDKYSASTSILFRDIGSSSVIASEDAEREAATNIELLSLDTIKNRVEQRLGGAGATAESVSVAQQGQSNVLKVKATDASPSVAARTANAYASEYVDFRRTAARRENAKAPDSAARVLSPARPPSSPSSPKPVRNTLIGAVVGLFLAGLAVLLLERLDPRLRTPKDAEAALESPILGLVRQSRRLAKPARRRVSSAEFDDFLALHSYLRYMGREDGDIRSVLITSGAPGDGKTTVAWYLASAAAAAGAKVLLIEGDLRQPSLAGALGVTPERGFADVLAKRATVQEVVQEVAVSHSNNGERPARVVDVAFAGADPSQTDPMKWERFGELIEEFENQYDLVVIDTPPIVSIPDAVPLLPYVGGVIVIGRLGSTPRGALVRLKEQLETVDARTLGAVVNGVGKNAAYGFGYGYGYAGRHASSSR